MSLTQFESISASNNAEHPEDKQDQEISIIKNRPTGWAPSPPTKNILLKRSFFHNTKIYIQRRF